MLIEGKMIMLKIEMIIGGIRICKLKFFVGNVYLIFIEKVFVYRWVFFDLFVYIYIINFLLVINDCIEYIMIYEFDLGRVYIKGR